MLVPFSWQKTNRNLQAALTSSIAAGDFWARSRGLRFLRFVHRLDFGFGELLILVGVVLIERTLNGEAPFASLSSTFATTSAGAAG